MRRHGLRTEVLLSLGLIMLLATMVLVAVFATYHDEGLRRLLGRSLLAEARRPSRVGDAIVTGTEWWWLEQDGRVRSPSGQQADIDPETLALAREARARGEPLLQLGGPGSRIRFAAPGRNDRVRVARLPARATLELRSAPLLVVIALGLANVAVFTAFGGWLLRRRVIGPLEQVAAAASEIGAGARHVRAPRVGPAEVVRMADSLNGMTDALQGQSEELEKAVADLRAANRDLRRARASLDRSERLAAVGQLAAGVAHEVGNPIGAILALIDLAGRDSGLSEEARKHLQRAAREGQRVGAILRQLLDFSRPARPEPAAMDLRAVAEEALALVSAQPRFRRLQVELRVEGSLPPALGDPNAVTQILLNLLFNAADAVAEGPGEKVGVLLRPAALERRRGEEAGGPMRARSRADGVECLVCDDGCGVPEGDRERIFDPFFTTKAPGEGTGLGLANSARLASELGGSLECVAAPGGYRTAFALRLRVADGGEGGASPGRSDRAASRVRRL